MTHVLTPTSGSTSVTVTVAGLPSTDATADWRYVLEDVSNYGTTSAVVNTYSPVYANNTAGTISLASSTDTVLLVVVATPGNTTLDLTSFDNTARDNQAPTRLTYPYEVQVSGATPVTGTAERIGYARSGSGQVWPNGGGWVDSTATVASTVYVAPGAEILGHAVVSGNVKVLDYAVIADTANVSGNAIVSGYAVVNGSAVVSGNARIEDHAMVGSLANVQGKATIEQYATLTPYASLLVKDNAVVRGEAFPTGGTLSGSAIVDYDYTSDFSLSDGVNDNNHPYDEGFSTYYETSQVKPRGLIASYRVNETSGSSLFDEFGALNAELRGSPSRVNDATLNSNVLSLNGTSQYALLDRSLADLTDGTYSMWVNPTSATANQPLLYFGSSANTFLDLVARDANGFAHLTISVSGTVQQLVSTTAVPMNAWTNIAVTFTGGVATFYVNGVAAGSGAMSFRPTDVLTSDAYSTATSLYLGHDASGNYFAGSLDDMRFYNVALSQSEIVNEIKRSGTTLGAFYATAPVTFSSVNSPLAQSGVHDGLTRTISAWIDPNSSPAVTSNGASYYQPIVDSTDERNTTGFGSGVGLNNGKFVVRLDGAGMWSTGVPVTLGQWQQVTLTFNGSTANLYINGALRATKSYTATSADGKNYRIGYGQTVDGDSTNSAAVASRTFFDGQIFDLEIADRVIVPSPGLPTGWAAQDVSTTGATGFSSFGYNTFAVNGAGTGVTGTSDKFQFAYTPLSSDGSITALVGNPQATGTNTVNAAATAGVMLRTSVNTSDPDAMLALTPSAGLVFQYRSTSGGTTTTNATLGSITGPTWLRLVRAGTSVTAFYSTDGTTFTQIGSAVTLASTPSLAGLAVSSHVSGTLAQAVFTGVSVTSTTGPTFVNQPNASATTVTGTTVNLSALGSTPNAGGESTLKYRWTPMGNWPAPVAFSANGTNASKNTTVTFYVSGTYSFQVAVYDAVGQVVYSGTLTIVVVPTLASISPSAATVIGGGTQSLAAFDQFGLSLVSGISWATTAGTITSAGVYTAPAKASTATITASMAGAVNQNAIITIISPTVWYQNDSITSSTSVTDSSGNGYTGTITGTFNSTYSSTTGEISNALKLSNTSTANGYVTLPAGFITALKTTTDFTISGWVNETSANNWARMFDFGTGTTKYMFLAPADGGGLPRFAITIGGNGAEQVLQGTTALTVGQWYFLAVTLSGTTGTLYVNGSAVATNNAMSLNPASLGQTTQDWLGKSQFGDPNLKGSIDDFRVYSAAASAGTIAAMYAAGAASASHMPSVATAAGASPAPVTGTTTTLSALGTETAGESNLTYTWSMTSGPAAVVYSANGNNVAKSVTATFTKAGSYTFMVTMADPLGYSAASSVTITVNQTPTNVSVTPPMGTTLASGATKQFSATVTDQFGATITSPTLNWSSPGGSVSGSGLFTAGSSGGTFNVTATSGSASGNAVVNIVPTNYPAASGDGFYVRLAGDGMTEQIWAGTPGAVGPAFGNPTYSILLSGLPSLTFGPGSSAAGALTVDESNGSPVPSGGMSFDGGAGNNTLAIIGTAGNDSVTVNATQVIFGSTPITYANTESIQVSLGSGSDTLSQTAQPDGGASLSLVNPTSSDTLSVTGGGFTFPAPADGAGIVPLNLGSLSIGSGASVALNTAANHSDRTVMELNTLSIAGSAGNWLGTFDIGGDDLIVHSASSAAANAIATNLDSQIRSAMANGGTPWTGTGLTSSVAASDPNQVLTIGVLVNDNGAGGKLYGSGAPKGLFDGLDAATTDVLLKSTYFGDADLSGSTDALDYSNADNGYNMMLSGWTNGDFNHDGTVNGADYSLIDYGFSFQGPAR
jgi:carbonic anhydrase/acetyltransferase-like protein (isoleucine patch superfamily)